MPSFVKTVGKRYKKKLKKRMMNKLGDSPISKRVKKFFKNFDKYKKDFHNKLRIKREAKKGGRRRKTRRRKTRRRKTRRRKTRKNNVRFL